MSDANREIHHRVNQTLAAAGLPVVIDGWDEIDNLATEMNRNLFSDYATDPHAKLLADALIARVLDNAEREMVGEQPRILYASEPFNIYTEPTQFYCNTCNDDYCHLNGCTVDLAPDCIHTEQTLPFEVKRGEYTCVYRICPNCIAWFSLPIAQRSTTKLAAIADLTDLTREQLNQRRNPTPEPKLDSDPWE